MGAAIEAMRALGREPIWAIVGEVIGAFSIFWIGLSLLLLAWAGSDEPTDYSTHSHTHIQAIATSERGPK